MRENNYPTPVSDPAAEGLPDTADDDSTAYDDVESGRAADGPDPAALPSDFPLAVDRFGTTAEEQRRGESLDDRLAQEEPDVAAAVDPVDAEADVLEPGPLADPSSPVSMYDRPLAGTADRPVGRLVDPVAGGPFDTEATAIAEDVGAAGGGASAEELAIHETTPPERG